MVDHRTGAIGGHLGLGSNAIFRQQARLFGELSNQPRRGKEKDASAGRINRVW